MRNEERKDVLRTGGAGVLLPEAYESLASYRPCPLRRCIDQAWRFVESLTKVHGT